MDPLLSVSPTVSSSATLLPTSHWMESVHDVDMDIDIDIDVDPATLSPPIHTHKRIRPRTEVVEPNLSIETTTTTTTTTTTEIFTPRIPLLSALFHSLTLPFSFHNRHHLLLIALACATTCHLLLFSWYTHLILTLAVIAISAATYSAYLHLTHYGLLYFLPPFLVDFLTHYSLLDISQMSWSSGITSDLACLFLFSLTPEEQDVITSRLPYEFQRLLRKRGIIQFLPSSLHHLIGLDQLQKIQQEQIRHQLEQEAVSPIMRSTPEPIARGFSHSSSHPSLLAFHRAAMSSLPSSRSHPTRMYTLDHHPTWEHDEKYDDEESKGEPDALPLATSITLPPSSSSSTSTTPIEERPINITTLLDRSVKHTIQSVVNNNSTIEYVHQVICNTWISFLPTSLRELITSPTIVNDTLQQMPIRLITCTSLFTLCIHLMISRNARMVARHVVTTGAEVSLYVTATAALTGMLYSYQQKQESSRQPSSIITTSSSPLTQRLIHYFMSHKFSLGGFIMIAWLLFLKRRRLGM